MKMRAAELTSLAGVILLVGALAAPVAGAQDAPAADADNATVVIVHGLRGFTADIWLDGQLLINTFEPERSTDPLAVPSGSHVVEIREAGAAPGSPPVVTMPFDLETGMRYEAVAHLDQGGTPTVSFFVDDVSPVPPGQARVTVRNTAAVPPIDVGIGPFLVASSLPNGGSVDSVLPAGLSSVSVLAAGTTDMLAPFQDLMAGEGTATFVYLIGSAEAQTLDWLAVQATGLQTAPVKVPTGDGSVTQEGEDDEGGITWPEAAGLGAVGLFFVGATRRRLRRPA